MGDSGDYHHTRRPDFRFPAPAKSPAQHCVAVPNTTKGVKAGGLREDCGGGSCGRTAGGLGTSWPALPETGKSRLSRYPVKVIKCRGRHPVASSGLHILTHRWVDTYTCACYTQHTDTQHVHTNIFKPPPIHTPHTITKKSGEYFTASRFPCFSAESAETPTINLCSELSLLVSCLLRPCSTAGVGQLGHPLCPLHAETSKQQSPHSPFWLLIFDHSKCAGHVMMSLSWSARIHNQATSSYSKLE